MKEEIFALDIGTRKVMGIVASRQEDFLEIIDVETIEHPTRAMFDGQIHNIEEVARTVSKIKNRLESRLNKKLQKVGVAVAGRNLLTYKIRLVREAGESQEVTPELIRDLELEAVDKIIFDSGKDLSEFYCVGYSPICYELDGNRITDAVGHRAKTITTEVIATFLPRIVLDSIFAVLKKVGLTVINITLEPISAINAIIPLEMRNLNIILVDIGAGTSDLALTKEGVVFAYGMVAEAGDEITDFISENLLTDFNTAEKIKRSLDKEKDIEYEDIWNRRKGIDVASLNTLLSPAVKKLSASIAKAGLDLNGTIPQAVICVGGGSLTTHLIEELAQSFGLAGDKVGIRFPSVIKDLKDKTGKLNGPEAVTPIGIALMTEKSQGLRFIEVYVNTKKLTMLDFQQKKDVMGALTLSGILKGKKLYPRPGLALTVKVNGDLKIIKGTLGVPAKVALNAKAIESLSDKIEDQDKIEFTEAIDGRDARAKVADLIKIKPIRVILNGQTQEVMPTVTVNGGQVSLDDYVCDRDIIEVLPLTIKDVLRSQDIRLENLSERQILVNINAVPKILTQRNFTLLFNGKTSELNAEVKADDLIEFSQETPTFYRISDVVDMPSGFQKMHINVDDKDIEVLLDTVQVFMNGHQVNPDEFLIDGADIRVYHAKERKIMLSEIFKYVEVDPHKVLGKRIRILVDNNPAGFTTPLVEGSRVRILFEDRNNGP